VHEGHEPDVLADLCHAEALAGEDVTEIHLAHIIRSATTESWAALPAVGRLVLFLILIIRFFLGSAVYFDEKKYVADRQRFLVDFTSGLLHFLFFYALAVSIPVHADSPDVVPRAAYLVVIGGIFFMTWRTSRQKARSSSWCCL
jgi:hypothetical protein